MNEQESETMSQGLDKDNRAESGAADLTSYSIGDATIAEAKSEAGKEELSFEEDIEEEFEDVEEYDDEDDDDDDDSSTGIKYMQNRELSWLTFNERVLDQGADESVPLLQRLNFISIFWSNLQEFFMVRVGSLTDLSYIDPPVHDSKTGMTPKEQIRAIHERCSELYPIQESYYEHVRGSLAKEGVRHLRPEDISEEQRNYLFGLVQHNIEPFLSPQIINSRHPFPHLENGKLYILVRLDDEASEAERKKLKKDKGKKKSKGAAEGVLLGLIPLPHQCDRLIKLPGRGFQFILLEHAIEMFVPEIFNMYKIKHTNVICVTRNADIDANQGFDEQDEDYREHMKRLLKQRARLAPVRLECERPLSPVMEKLMLNKLGLKRHQVYDTIVPLDLSFTWGLGSYLKDKKVEKLSDAPFSPAWPTCFDKNRRIMDQVAERETLLFYPYESMDPFVQLLREAAVDPDVVSIKITLYRLASQSHLAEALIAAADNGKEVTALFELRARFDENNNIVWSQRFEEAGCNVIYGFRDYKVHSKICCITRRTADGVQHITQLGTGNYNEKTAKLYTDLSFITTSEEFGRDAVEFFRNMQLENVSDNYKVLRVAPLQIKPLILENLDKQIANARAGKPASAFMKANSVTDKDVMEKISEASNAGVKITLFIRGICCLVPRVKGATENVRVVSIVGRLLEHSRIYCFGTGDDCVVYLSSADLMTRNLNKRVEIAWPVLDPELRNRVLTYIEICMSDTAKLRELRRNSTYTPLGAFCDIDDEGNATPAFDAQATLIDQATEAARMMSELEEQARLEAEESASAAIAAAAAAAAEVVSEPAAAAPEAESEPASEDIGAASEASQDAVDEKPAAPVAQEASQQVEDTPSPEIDAQETDELEPTATEASVPPEDAAVSPSEEVETHGEVPHASDAEPVADADEKPLEGEGAAAVDEAPDTQGNLTEATAESTPDEVAPEAALHGSVAESAPVEAEEAVTETEPAEAKQALAESTPAETENASKEAAPVEAEDASTEAAPVEAENVLKDATPIEKPAEDAPEQAGQEPIASASDIAETAEPTVEASERVAELINQLGSNTEQKVDAALEPLTDMKIEDIVSPLEADASPSQTVSAQATSIATGIEHESSAAAALIAEEIASDVSSAQPTEEMQPAVEVQPATARSNAPSALGSDNAVSPTPSSAVTQAQPSVQNVVDDGTDEVGDYKKAPEGAVESYFNKDEAREIEVPKKKKGFWSRWFG